MIKTEGGWTNKNFSVDEKRVIKLHSKDTTPPDIIPTVRTRMEAFASSHGLSPKLYYHDECIQVSEYLKEDASQGPVGILEKLKSISTLDVDIYIKDWRIYYDWYQRYMNELSEDKVTSDIYVYCDMMDRTIEDIILHNEGECLIPCHCDLVRENMILDPIDSKIIDWERAGYSFWGLDIVTWLFTDTDISIMEIGSYLQQYTRGFSQDLDRIAFLLRVWTLYSVGWSARYESEGNRLWLEIVKTAWDRFERYRQMMLRL